MLYLLLGDGRPPTKCLSWSELGFHRLFVGLIVPDILRCIDFGVFA